MITEKTEVAMRVLAAYNTRQNLNEVDQLLLCLYCPDYAHLESDELAFIVIQNEINAAMAQRERGHLPLSKSA